MISYILWTLLIYFAYVAAHGVLRLNSSRDGGNILTVALGNRDGVTEKSAAAQRAARAQKNMEESLFFFLPLALLLMMTGKADGQAMTGALLFVLARAAYLPSYIMGVFALRTVVWTIAVIGIVLMIVRLHV